ncbi:hypothetical protein [Williamsoniiplasma lucivorax]|uniref:Lipoprotein n=1 Tax=Williamsoniiplasma lucivorax TaxID=209274 RepID=A0A2S5REW5_9MOLU|nr:hypothetical protein [Williamsoniiplasma lucivorax]PPE05869.1 hypothetical protein ELUCI_v1c01570 [Williamsoniiplasma lucivorax]
MKKLLSLLSTISLVGVMANLVVACSMKVSMSKPISNIKTELQSLLDNRDTPWTKQELEKEIVNQGFDVEGGITVERQLTNRSLGEIQHNWIFIGHGSVNNDFKYNGQINLLHKIPTDTTQPISNIQTTLQDILNSRTDKPWTKEELEKEIVYRQIDGKGGITVEKQLTPRTSSSNNHTWRFIGHGNVDNAFKYRDEISLIHNFSTNITEHISKISTKLQDILKSRPTKPWTQLELQKAIADAKLDIRGGITVQPKLAPRSINPVNNTWTFFGHAEENPKFKYHGKIDLTHTFLVNEPEHISTISNDLWKILDSRTDKPWTASELEDEIVLRGIEIRGGIKVYHQPTIRTNTTNKESFKFVGMASDKNTFKYNKDVTLEHHYETIIEPKFFSIPKNQQSSLLKPVGNEGIKYTIIDTNIGKIKNYSKMEFLTDQAVVVVKAQGALGQDNLLSSIYWKQPIRIDLNKENNRKIKPEEEWLLDQFTTIPLLNANYVNYNGSASVKYGYTWYEEKGNYHLQFLTRQTVEQRGDPVWMLSNAINFGAEFKLS